MLVVLETQLITNVRNSNNENVNKANQVSWSNICSNTTSNQDILFLWLGTELQAMLYFVLSM